MDLRNSFTLFAVHLESVDVQVFITGFVAKAHSVLTYKNSESTSIETLFTFPLDENAAVYHFQAQVGNTIVVAECQHKTEVILICMPPNELCCTHGVLNLM